MARFLELKKPWDELVSVNIDHISSVTKDRYTDKIMGIYPKEVVTITMLSGQILTVDVPYDEFMKLLIPLSLSGAY